jgi:hypothetical protein
MDAGIKLSVALTIFNSEEVLAPILAAVGAMAALLTKCTIIVERKPKKK